MSGLRVASAVEIVPAILLSADGDDTPARPDGHDEADWADWRERNRMVLGLSESDVPDKMHTAIRAVDSDRLIGAVVDYALACAEDNGELYPYMDGGVVILFDGDVVVAPQCCVELGDGLDGWVEFFERRSSAWEVVDTGHPAVFARVVEGVVEVSEQLDDLVEVVAARADAGAFSLALTRMQAERSAFADRLEENLRERGYEHPVLAAKIIAGLVEPT